MAKPGNDLFKDVENNKTPSTYESGFAELTFVPRLAGEKEQAVFKALKLVNDDLEQYY